MAPPFGIAIRPGSAPQVRPAAAVAPVAASEPEPSDWWRYRRAIMRYKWTVIGVTLAGTLAGFVATRYLDSRYAAKTTLWIESTDRDRGPAADEHLLGAPGWVELVTSSVVLDSVVRSLRLYLVPGSPADAAALATFAAKEDVRPGEYRLVVDGAGRRFRLTSVDGQVSRQGALGDSIAPDLGFAWVVTPGTIAAGRTVEFTLRAPYDASQGLANDLRVRADVAGNFLRIQLRETNADVAAATLNAIAERVVVVAAELKRQKYEELERILGGQMDHAHVGLRAAEQALKNFRVRTAGVLTDETRLRRSAAGDDLGESDAIMLRASLEELRRDRRLLRGLLADSASGVRSVEALATVRAVRESPELTLALQEAVAKHAELRAYRYKYTDASEPVQRVRADLEALEQGQIPTLVRELVAELDAREAALTPRVDTALQDLRAAPPLALTEARLERDLASAEELYTHVRQRHEAARLALVSSLPDVRILDRAVRPARPVSDFAPLVMLLSFVASFGLVVAGVTVADRVDPRVQAPEQVTQGLNLTILAAVPHVQRRSAENGGDGAAPVIEALRGLRLRLLHASEGPSFAVTVTSPGPGEGKSFLSANLALSFAQAGYRVALVDGDIRRGTQHRVLDAAGTPGLTDVLIGKASLETAMQATAHAGVFLLSAGRRLHRSPELLLSRAMREVMAQLRQNYDVVVVDSPPLAAGVDPLVLATVTGRLLLVLRAGATDLQMAASKLEVLQSLPVEALGAVLNDVRQQGPYRYYTYGVKGYELPADDRAVAEWNEPPRIVGGES